MDLSKLPKLSETKSQLPDPVNNPVPVLVIPQMHISYVDTFLGVGVGLLMLLFYPRFLQWAASRLFHTHFDEFMENGNVVAYQSVPEFWSDLGPTLLGIVLILDGLLILIHRPILVLLAMVLTLIGTGFNLVYVIVSFPTYGLAPVSLLATIFGGFIIFRQWAIYRALQSQSK